MSAPASRASRDERPALRAAGARRVAYVMTSFPALSETFVLNEMIAVEREGVQIIPVSLSRPRDRKEHEAARTYREQTLYPSRDPAAVMLANFGHSVRIPSAYARAASYVLTGHPASWFTCEPGRSTAWKTFLLFPFLVEMARRLRDAGVAHVHATSAAIAGTAAIILSRLLRCSFSFTGHHSDLWFYPPDDLPRRIERGAFFTTVATYNRDRLISLYPTLDPARIHVVRLGVPLDRFRPGALPGISRQGHGDPILLTVSRLHPVKGCHTLLEAARMLAARKVGFRWRIVGDGPLRGEMERAAHAPLLAGRLEILGPRSQDELVDLFSRADVFVLPSRSEGLPVVLMEALACGIPCVSTAVNGTPEIVKDGLNGILVQPDNPLALVGAVERLIRDPELRRRLAAAARPSVERDYDLRVSGGRMADLFRASIDRLPRPADP